MSAGKGMLVDQLFDELNEIVTARQEDSDQWSATDLAILSLRDRWAELLSRTPSHYDDPRWLAEFTEEPDEHGGADYRVTLDVWVSIHQDDTDDNQYLQGWRAMGMDDRLKRVALEKVIDSIQGGSVDVDEPGDLKVVWLPRDE